MKKNTGLAWKLLFSTLAMVLFSTGDIGAAPTTIVLTGPASVTAGEASGNFTLTVLDEFGDPTLVGQDTTFTLSSTSGGTVTYSPTSPVTILNGASSVTFTYTDTESGTPTVTATWVSGGTDLGSHTHGITVDAAAAAQLAFVQQPTDAVAGVTIAPAVTVQLQDTYGNSVSSAGVSIGLGLSSSTLNGAASQNTDANGLATFNDLSVNLAAVNYTLTASSGALTSAVSDPFDITSAAASAVVLSGPASVTAGTASGNFTLTAVDPFGNTTLVGQDTTFTLSSTSGGTVTYTPSSPVTILSGQSSVTFTYTDTQAGTPTMTATWSAGGTNLGSATHGITVNPAAAAQLTFATSEGAGNALNVSGGQYAALPRPVADDFTIEFWFRSTEVSGGETQWYHGAGLVDAEVGGVGNDFGITLGNGKVLFGVGNPDITIRSGFVADGSWRHVAARRVRSTGQMTLFIDGVQVASANGNASSLTSPANITIGLLQTGIQPLNGTIDEVRIWNVARTSTEIQESMVERLTGSETGLVVYYRCDETGGTALADEAGTAQNATIYNGATFVSSGAGIASDGQPTDTVAGTTITPSVAVQVQDAYGNNVNSAGISVALALSSGTLNGTASQNTDSNGLATFNDLSINLAAVNYTLTASSIGLASAVSDPFDITAAAASAVVLNGATSVTAGEASGNFTLTVQDQFGNTAVTAQDTTFDLSSTSTGTVTYTPSSPVTILNGASSVTFTYSDTRAGTPTVAATWASGGVDLGSDTHGITVNAAAAAKLAYVQQPTDAVAGVTIAPAVTVQLQDTYGNNVSSAGVDIAVAKSSGNGILSGTTPVATDVNGLATFNDLSIQLAGTKELTATSPGLTDAVSDSFVIVAGAAAQLVFVQQPTDAVSEATIAPSVTVQSQDIYGNTVSSAGVGITMAKSSGTGILSGTTPVATDVNGLATFSDLNIDIAGIKELTASSVGLTSAISDSFEIIPGLPVDLVFVDSPVLETAGELFSDQPIVRTIDSAGNFTTNVGGLSPVNEFVTFSLMGGPGILSGSLSLDIVNGSPGTITGFDMSANMAGTNWQLVATNSVLGSVTSSVFTVVSPYLAPAPFGTNGIANSLLSDGGPTGLWLANLRGDRYSGYTPSVGVVWRDLVVANYNSNSITVRLSKDDGTFETPVTYETGLNPFAVRSGSYSDYTFEDVAVANFGTNTVSLFESVKNGTGQLLPRVDYQIGSTPNPGPIAISSAFASGARYADLFVANSNECTVSVLRNVSGTFVLETNIPVGLNPMSIQSVDIDGDSMEDIVTANQGDGTLTILRGQPNFTFIHWKTITLFPGGQPQPTYALAGDLNGDGLKDIAVANGGSNTVSILLQNSSQEFTLAANHNVGLHPRCLLLRDLNRDQNLDIAVANFAGATVDILIGNGDGSFEGGGRIATGRNPLCVVGSNLNGDGTTDILVSNYGDDTISIFLYSGPIANSFAITTIQNQPVNIGLNGSLLNSDGIGYMVLDSPANGTLTGTPPNLVYTPANNFVGTNTFRYQTFHTNYTGPESFQFPPSGSFNTNYPSMAATVTIIVKPVNQAPSFTLTTNRITVASSATLQTITNVATDVSAGINEVDQTVLFFVATTNKSFFSVLPTLSTNGTLTFKPSHAAVGTNVVEIRLQDNGSTVNGGVKSSSSQQLQIVVLPNVAPSFQLSTNLVAAQQFSPTQTLLSFATQITAGENEAGQTATFVMTVTNTAFFTVQPSITANGTLTFAPSWSAAGTNYVRVSLRDNGPTALGGVNQSADQIFAISVPSVPNPFTQLRTLTYNGLFSDTNNGVAHHSAGYLTFKVNSKRAYSGKLFVDGNAVGFSGKFNGDGTATITTKTRQKKFDKPELTLNLVLDTANSIDSITGTIAEGATWTAQLSADRLVWTADLAEQATAYTNRYTMSLGGFTNKTDGPTGSGYGLIKLDRLGRIKSSGAMGDGLLLKQSTFLSQDGYWPFFSRGYKVARLNALGARVIETEGLVMGWLNFETNAFGNMAPAGNLHWIKTGWTNATYAVGFTNDTVAVQGSRWVLPAVMNMTNALVSFAEGDLGANLFSANFLMRTNTSLVLSNGVVNPNLARIGSSPTTGVFKGSFIHPVAGTATRYFGVLLQDDNLGRGHFMGSTESGTVDLISAD